jgi:tRNA dimethylallyltransferase
LSTYNSIIILGPTASGKTRLAAHLAHTLRGVLLSFDSRQVYEELNIGAGKDLDELMIENETVPYYLVDICNLDDNFHSYAFVKSYIAAFEDCKAKNLLPILCGGTGLYFDLALKQYQNINIPVDDDLRKNLDALEDQPLREKLLAYNSEWRTNAEPSTRKRIIRSIEIAEHLSKNESLKITYPKLNPIIFGINLTVPDRAKRIEERLEQRLNNGLIDEVNSLLNAGILPERLIQLGLEYKFVTEYLTGKFDKPTMVTLLQTAINQYAKRQMTWFRKMEREGNIIHWIDGTQSLKDQLNIALKLL